MKAKAKFDDITGHVVISMDNGTRMLFERCSSMVNYCRTMGIECRVG